MTDPLPVGATIGILGGGQLGRMLAMAAARLGLHCHIYDPAADGPAAEVARQATSAGWDDTDALDAFARGCDVVTYEFENVPTETLDRIEAVCPIRPGREALRISQDRLIEKDWLADIGCTTAPFADIATADDLRAALSRMGGAGLLKTRRFGYDGKGQVRIETAEAVEDALASMNGAPAILEGLVAFEREISVIGARGADGGVVCFDPGENVHEGGILRTTTVPAAIPASLAQDAVLLTGRLLNALDYVGVLGVELFVTDDGLVVNEIAPRVHNSGHWTQDGCVTDQFDQHIRTVAGWPLGDGRRHSDVVMTNLIGDEVDNARLLIRDPACALHLYGKAEARAGRKMGHVNRRIGTG